MTTKWPPSCWLHHRFNLTDKIFSSSNDLQKNSFTALKKKTIKDIHPKLLPAFCFQEFHPFNEILR